MGEVAAIQIGPFGTLLHKEDYIKNGNPVINPSNIIDGKIYPDNEISISSDKYESLKSYHLLENDVVLARRGEMGRCAVVTQPGLLCGTGSMIIRPAELLKPYFVNQILSSPCFKKYIESKAVGVTMLNLNAGIVAQLSVPLLPLEMQEKFVNFIQQIETTKSSMQAQLQQAETLKAALMQQYFSQPTQEKICA